ncbi:MAG: hypothetical protein IKO35_02750, partial [Elusimicrobiaceae bacterium]|nr:hypothetical protein [Elusimicrobiaceae bacterium]
AKSVEHKTVSSSARHAGVLYSGIPFFALTDMLSKINSKIQASKAARKEKQALQAAQNKPTVEEEPGLHDNEVHAISELVEMPQVTGVDDLFGPEGELDIAVEEGGFKLTVENAQGVEQILHNVDVQIDASIKTDGYNRIALSKDYVFELRNLKKTPLTMGHFFFELPYQEGQLWNLLQSSPTETQLVRPLRIKLERVPNVRYQTVALPVRVLGATNPVQAVAEVDTKLLPKNASGSLLVEPEGAISYIPEHGEPVVLEDFYVRLPKEDSKYWMPLLQKNPLDLFTLRVHPTAKKTTLLTTAVPGLQIGLGKTLAPELSSRTTLSEASSSTIMLGINNVLPALMGFLHTPLKRYGEAAVLRFGTGFFVAGGATALASGLYGQLGSGVMSSLQMTGFITSSVLIALGTNITRFVNNLLISANRGKIVPADSFSKEKKVISPEAGPVEYNWKHVAQRTKEVFIKKPPTSTRDVILFQTAQMMKNVGTLAFLSFPYLANLGAKGLLGVDLGLDFSASYVPYAVFGGWTAYKLSQSAYKNTVPMNLTSVENSFKETSVAVSEQLLENPDAFLAGSETLRKAAKKLKDSIDTLTRAEVRQKKGAASKLAITHEKECVETLRETWLKQGKTPEQAEAAAQALQQTFDVLGHRDTTFFKLMKEVIKTPKLAAGIAGMTLATVHELSMSNGLAFTVRSILPDGVASNAVTATALYGTAILGRAAGNWINRRVSGGSMYAISSASSIIGTGLMIGAGDSIGSLAAGAAIASFGVGNFFSQMFEYLTGLAPKYRREISLLINYTMPAAAVISMPMRQVVAWTNIPGIDLMIAGGALAGSLILTRGMFANSSLVQTIQNNLKKTKNLWKNSGSRKTPPSTGLDNAAPAY